MADDTTAPAPAASPDVLAQLAPYLALLQQGQAQPARDDTPVERSWVSKVGEALGGPFLLPGMTPAEKEIAGRAALSHFGTGLLNASGNLQGGTIFTALGRGFDAAERGALGAQQFDASTLAAQQDWQQKQQEMRLAAIKEAIPLLSLQQSQQRLGALGALPPAIGAGTTGAPNIATGGSIAAAGKDDFVQKFTPLAQVVSAQTGLPVDYVIGQAGLETGWGKSSAAANNNFFGITDPKTGKLMSYASPQEGITAYTQLMQSDRYKGVPRTGTPAEIGDRMAQAGYNPNVPAKDKTDSYGARIGTFASGLGQPKSPAPYQVATAGSAVPPPPGGAPAAPATDLTGPRPLPPTGPGAGVATPASIANTPAQTAQAQPPAPAGGTGTPPAPTAPAGPPEFTYVPRPPPPGTIQGGDLTGAEQSVVQDARNSYAVAIRAASLIPDAAKAAEARAQAEATLQATLDKELTARTGRTDAGAKQLTDWYSADFKQQQDVHKAQLDDYYKGLAEQRAAQIKSDELEHQARIKATENDQTSRLASRAKVLDKLDTDAGAAQENLSQLRMVKQLSDAAGQPGVLAGYPDVRSWMVKLGIATPEQASQWSAQQALDASTQKLTLAAASGAGLGRLTDKDLDFLRKGTPQSVNPQDWRNAQMGYLMTLYDRKQKFVGLVHQGVADGKSLTDAQTAADEQLGPIIKQRPTVIKGVPLDKTGRAQWNFDNLEPGQFYKDERGNIRIFNPGNATRPE